MHIVLSDGRYIIAVSGGVDSVVLLDCIVQSNPNLLRDGKLIVAHFDHGIRRESTKDALFVEELAEKYGVQFVVGHGGLGSEASEDTARKARYSFLETIKVQNKADAIITGHHQDDVVETAIINLLRGTGRRGLSSLKERKGLLRPLLVYKKADLVAYANKNKLNWREDESNLIEKYLRNRIRKFIKDSDRAPAIEDLMKTIETISVLNYDIDREVDRLLQSQLRRTPFVMPRRWFVKLRYELACEVAHAQLRNIGAQEINAKLVELLVVFMKTGKIGKKIDLDKGHYALITKRSIRFVLR